MYLPEKLVNVLEDYSLIIDSDIAWFIGYFFVQFPLS